MKYVVAATLALVPLASAPADAGECRVVDLTFQTASSGTTPEYRPQIVGWIEDTAGTYVDTIYITHMTGTYGLGNRPGRFDFNSSPFWPYGRRITTFPVWAHKHGLEWPELRFQDDQDSNLSHAQRQSSVDSWYCRPLLPSEFDAVSCPSAMSYTDKGIMSTTRTSKYPPRNDLNPLPQDSPSVAMYATLNPFDAVSMPTPLTGTMTQVAWAIPADLPTGDYVLFLEVSKEFDMNSTYNETVYPAPSPIPWDDYGLPYRGQPSVIYRVPFTVGVGDVTSTATTATYAGYGDPDGLDGAIRAPDSTISDAPGSGAGRLALVADGGDPFRVRVVARAELDETAPAEPRDPGITELSSTRAVVAFTAPGDDGLTGRVQSYEIRYRVREPITEDNFASSTIVPADLEIRAPGEEQTFELKNLLPETTYYVAIRAYDNCRNASPLQVLEITTPERPVGEVDACFIATAAYGSVMADDVELLRRFRDSLLSKTAFGELAIETYYTFGPAFAGMIGESDVMRATAREALHPIVTRVKNFRF